MGCEPGVRWEQIQTLKPIANTSFQLHDHATAREAWGQALHALKGLDYKALLKVVEYYQAWDLSTCGVEHAIGAYHQECTTAQQINDELECLFIHEDEASRIAEKAAALYREAYGCEQKKRKHKAQSDIGSMRQLDNHSGSTQQMVLHITTAAEAYRQKEQYVTQMVAYNGGSEQQATEFGSNGFCTTSGYSSWHAS